jgi:hypothetical protein
LELLIRRFMVAATSIPALVKRFPVLLLQAGRSAAEAG